MRCAVFSFYPMEYVIRKQTSENRYQKSDTRKQVSESRYQRTDIREQETEIRHQKTGIRNQKSEHREQITETREQKSEDRRQKTDVRNQKTGNRKRKSEIRNQISRLWAVICLRVSDPRLPAVFLFPRAEVFRNMIGNDPLCVFCPCIER